MNKKQFIETLRNKLSKFPQKEVEDSINFYSEMIDDKIEDGISEEDAVKEIGDIDNIVSLIVADIPLTKIVKEKIKPKRKFRTWEIVLLVIGSPLWLSLLVSAIAVVFSVYVSLWAVVVALWAGTVSIIAVGVYEIIYGIIMMFVSDTFINLSILGLGIVCIGLAIFLCIGCIYATKGLVLLTKKIILAIKNSFVKKEEK